MKDEVAINPTRVRFFRARTVVQSAQQVANLLKQFLGLGGIGCNLSRGIAPPAGCE